jgi:Flp pilus assembly pilin Flp
MHRDARTDAARTAEDGQTRAEYAVVLSVITLAVMLSIQLLGDTAGGVIQGAADLLGGIGG